MAKLQIARNSTTDVYTDTEYSVIMLAVLAEHRGFVIRKMPLKFGTGGLKMSKLTLDEAIKHCEEQVAKYERQCEYGVSKEGKEYNSQCAADYRQLAEWLTELKQWRRVYGVCPSYEMCIPECKEGYNAQIAEYKRLLKAAVEDMNKEADCGICLHDNDGECPIEVASCKFKWRYADEALALIGEDGEQNG